MQPAAVEDAGQVCQRCIWDFRQHAADFVKGSISILNRTSGLLLVNIERGVDLSLHKATYSRNLVE